MRIHDQSIVVDVDSSEACPRRFHWRRRLWKVDDIHHVWMEAGPWWVQSSGDLMAEHRCWRVHATCASGESVVVDLTSCGDQWWLRAVMD